MVALAAKLWLVGYRHRAFDLVGSPYVLFVYSYHVWVLYSVRYFRVLYAFDY